MLTVRIGLLITLCTSNACFGQTLANADTVEAYGLLLIGGLNKFEYGASEVLIIGLKVENRSASPITIPEATRTCAVTFIEEIWCRPDNSECWESPPDGWCLHDRLDPYPPGTTWLYNAWSAGWDPGNYGWVHGSGRVRFTNPWDTPLKLEVAVDFQRSPLVGVEFRSWGTVKRLYR